MKKVVFLMAFMASAACLAAEGVRTVTTQPRKNLKVLMIGNSFSICLLQQFPFAGVTAVACDQYITVFRLKQDA